MIHYISPYSTDKNIGGAINAAIGAINYGPEDWFVLTDHDMLWLLPDSKAQVERILGATDFKVLGCMTNRIRSREQLVSGMFIENDKIRDHIILAEKCRDIAGDRVKTTEGTVAAFMLCFRVSVWIAVAGFVENVLTFDTEFCREVRLMTDAKIGIMQGVYVWHSYRLMSKNPKNDIKHLTK